ncbi:MAG: cytochrome c [Pseudomonadota bacterium]
MAFLKPLALTVTLGAALLMTSSGSFAQDSFQSQLKARKGQFSLLALNVGVLGGMARGNMDYDAGLAQEAAENIVAIAALNQTPLWPEGSDGLSIEGTRAKPEIWEDFDDFASKWAAVATAADGLPDAVGDGVAAIGPALGALGGTCKDCHDTYRAPRN